MEKTMVIWVFAYLNFGVVSGFIFDLNHPVIIVDPESDGEKSQFGRSVVLYTDNESGEKWIKVSAPKGSFSHPGSKTIANSGLVYHCPYMDKCTLEPLTYSSNSIFSKNYKEKYSLMDSLLGAAMDVNYKSKTLIIGASNWHYFDTLDSPKIRGGIIVENITNKSIRTDIPFKGEDLILNGLPYFARAMGGFSVHFPLVGKDVLLGAPGVYNYIGTVMDIKNIQNAKQMWEYQVAEPKGRYNEYLGYSLTSGQFQNNDKLYYVTGIPRGQKDDPERFKGVLLGAVAVFTFKEIPNLQKRNHFDIDILRIIMGTQMGEYFGHSLAAGDLDRDGLDDLLVGAPFRQNDRDGFNHGSVYIFTKGNLVMDGAMRIDGSVNGGQFGTAMMFLGDMDKDGTSEVAISAPHEDHSGVVYIYSYEKSTRSMVVTQRIAANSLYPNLRGFGMSFSKPRDIDDNLFDDIVIGAPISGHVVLLRSRQVVIINRRMEVPMFTNTSDKQFSFKCCYSYSDYPAANLSILRKLSVDQELRRFSLSDKNTTETKEVTMEGRKEFCERIYLARTNKTKVDFKEPIPITLTYEISEKKNDRNDTPVMITKDGVQGMDAFCKTCPILRRKSVTTLTKQVNWDHSCLGPNGRRSCVAKVEIAVNFVNLSEPNTFILGSANSLYIKVKVWNEGDTALSPQLEIVLPDGINFRKHRVNCEDTEANLTICHLGENLEKQVTTVFEVNMKNINDAGEEGELTFFFNRSTITQNNGDLSGVTLKLKLTRVADFSILGESKESTYSIDEDRSTKIKNIFKIEKFGPSSVQKITAYITIPYKITGSRNNFTKIIETKSGNSNAELIQCERVNSEPNIPRKRKKRLTNLFSFLDSSNENTTITSAKTLYLNCSSKIIDCEFIECKLGPFSGIIKHAEILIEMDVDFTSIEDMLNFKESIQISTQAHILMDFSQNGNETDVAEISNIIIIYKDYRISLWILVGSVIAGFVILICFSIGLAKAGFFKREKHEKLMALKEELEEERLIDEMIKKEMAKDETDEQTKFFGDEILEEKDL